MSTAVQPRPLLTVPEVADRLGVSTRTVRRRIESGELAAVRLGSGPRAPIRIERGKLDAWLSGHSLASGSRAHPAEDETAVGQPRRPSRPGLERGAP